MRKLKQIIEYINEELEDANKYADYAMSMKGIDDMACNLALKYAQEERTHADGWHDVVVKEIQNMQAELKARGQEAPPYMIEMWQDDHKQIMDFASKIDYKIANVKKMMMK